MAEHEWTREVCEARVSSLESQVESLEETIRRLLEALHVQGENDNADDNNDANNNVENANVEADRNGELQQVRNNPVDSEESDNSEEAWTNISSESDAESEPVPREEEQREEEQGEKEQREEEQQRAGDEDNARRARYADLLRRNDPRPAHSTFVEYRNEHGQREVVAGAGWIGENTYEAAGSRRTYDTTQPPPQPCFNCRGNHWRKDCPYRLTGHSRTPQALVLLYTRPSGGADEDMFADEAEMASASFPNINDPAAAIQQAIARYSVWYSKLRDTGTLKLKQSTGDQP